MHSKHGHRDEPHREAQRRIDKMENYAFDAFISYSHRDMKWGRWLQRRLETFSIPREKGQQKPPRSKLRVFRDQTDLAGAELQASLNRELENSRFLIVICSPYSAASRWVNEEIRHFCSLGRRDHIIPFIVSGEPNSDHPELECYPPALRIEAEDELLGANIQEIGKNKAFLKVVSVVLDLRLNRLVDREKQRRLRVGLTTGSLIAISLTITGILLWRNVVISRKNEQLSFDIYGAAIVSYAQKDAIGPAELSFLEESAAAGNVDAMMLLADCYQNGWGTEVSPSAALNWYSQAAEAGSTQGMIAVANCYLNGLGVEEDPEQVFLWNLRAAEMGDPAGMVNVASCFEEGYGVAPDSGKTYTWYAQAAESGYDLGMYHLSRSYRSGIGTEADPSQSFFWMKKLAETGNHEGMYNLALMYQYGYGTVEEPREAYLWYRKAAEAGYADAMRMVGWCIENRYGVYNLPLEWYMKAVESGDASAMEDVERILAAAEQPAE